MNKICDVEPPKTTRNTIKTYPFSDGKAGGGGNGIVGESPASS